MSIKINGKSLVKGQINGKEIQKIVINGNVVYSKSSPTPTGNPYKAVIRDYDGSGTYQVIDIYDNSNNTLIITSQSIAPVLVKLNKGIWSYQINNMRGALSNTLYEAGIYGTTDYSNSTGKLHMVYTKTGMSWFGITVYIRVKDTNGNIYYDANVVDTVTDAVQDINIASFPDPNYIPQITMGGYTSTDYSSGSSYFTLNVVSTTLEFDFDVSQ